MFGPRPRLCGRNPELLTSASRARGTGPLHITIRGTLASSSGELRRQCNQAPAWKSGTKGGTRAACRGRRRHCVITRKAGDERELRPVDVTEYPILDQRFEVLVMRLPTPREEHHMFGTAPLCAASSMRRASAALLASGFSQRTCKP